MKTEKLDYRNGDDDHNDLDDDDDVDDHDDSIVWLVGEVSWPDRLWTAGLCLAHYQPSTTAKYCFSNITIITRVFERVKNTSYSFL